MDHVRVKKYRRLTKEPPALYRPMGGKAIEHHSLLHVPLFHPKSQENRKKGGMVKPISRLKDAAATVRQSDGFDRNATDKAFYIGCDERASPEWPIVALKTADTEWKQRGGFLR